MSTIMRFTPDQTVRVLLVLRRRALELGRHLLALWLVLAFTTIQAQPTGGPRNGLTVSMPNGFAIVSADDLRLKTTAGELRWSRVWNGQEWKFNPQWESLSQSWKNLTGSQAADTTGIVGNSSAGSGGNCWVTADEDWTAAKADASGIPPMLAARTTPFNRQMDNAGTDYAPTLRVDLDYASLCPGVAVTGGAVNQEALRRGNGLYLGQNGHYAFNNRSTIEKRAVDVLPAVTAAASYAQLGTGRISLAPVSLAKGYRWLDRAGEWINFNTQGQVVAYGDRNNNTVWLVRDTEGRLRGVVDASGRVLLTLHYSGELLTEVRDYPDASNALDLPGRSVAYQYDAHNRLIQATDARGNPTRYEYDSTNRIVKITDPEGRAEQLAYNGSTVSRHTAPDGGVTDYSFEYDDANKQFVARKSRPTTAAGRRVEQTLHNRVGQLVQFVVNGRADDVVSYDSAARTESHTNARGFTTVRATNEFGQTVQVRQNDGSLVSASYSALHLQTTEQTDEAGVKTVFEHDAKGNLLKRLDAAGLPEERVTEYSVNALGQTVQIVQKGRTEVDGSVTPDAVWMFEYDALGQVSKATDPEGNVRRYVFDRAGNLASETDPRGNTSRYTIDAAGSLTQAVDALGRTSLFAYDKVGNLTRMTDARGKVTLAAYDAMNRLVQSTNAVGGVYKRQYDVLGQLVNEADEDGVQRSAQFDTFQRLTQITDGLGNLTKLSYAIPDGSDAGALGSLSAPTEIQFPTFTQRQRYDALERPTASSLLNPSAQGLQTITGGQTYDKVGLITGTTDAAGNQRLRTFDALGQPTQFTDALGGKTRLQYDARGNLLSLTDANGNTHRFAYDRNDRLLQETLPLGQQTSYQYDATGNLSQRIDAVGNKAVFSYDAANRLSTIRRHDAQGTQVRDTALTWDEADNLTAWSDTDMTRPAGQQTSNAVAVYDDANRKTRETTTYPNPAGGTYAMSTGYAYSPAGRKTQLLWPDGSAIGYGYSPHGVLQSVQIPGEGTVTVNSFNWTAPSKITLPGGSTQQIGYDGLLKQESLKVTSPSQQAILNLDNRYGVLQELQSKTRTDADANGASSTITTNYAYDDENRLTRATTDRGAGTPDVETFTLDAVANRVAHSKTQGTWTYDQNNRLLQSGTGPNSASYQWDEAGRLIKKIEASGRIWQYGYDVQDRLVEVRDDRGQLIARYGYDPMDRRLWKEAYLDANGLSSATGARTYFLYGDEGLVGEAAQSISISSQGEASSGVAPSIDSLYGIRPDSEFNAAGVFLKTTDSTQSRVVSYYHLDQLRTPHSMTDRRGNVIWSAETAPFGDLTHKVSQINSRIGFQGQYRDEESALRYNFRRYYESASGRYLTRDPIGLEGGVNAYSYVAGDPINAIDPTGEVLVVDNLIGGAIGVAFGKAISWALGDEYTLCDAARDFAIGFATSGASGLLKLGRLGKVSKGGKELPPLRKEYVDEVRALEDIALNARAAGASPEGIARMLNQLRRDLGVQYKNMTPARELKKIYARNVKQYGDKLGPTIDWLRAKGKSWDQIIESSYRPGGKDLGF